MIDYDDLPLQLDVFEPLYHLTLTPDELPYFRRELNPNEAADPVWGGNQRLAARLQAREQHGELDMTGRELASAMMKAFGYGNGTWEKYFIVLIDAAKRVGWEPTPQLLADVREHREKVLARGKQPAWS